MGLAIFSAMFVTGLIVLSIRLIVFRMKRSVEKPYRLQKLLGNRLISQMSTEALANQN